MLVTLVGPKVYLGLLSICYDLKGVPVRISEMFFPLRTEHRGLYICFFCGTLSFCCYEEWLAVKFSHPFYPDRGTTSIFPQNLYSNEIIISPSSKFINRSKVDISRNRKIDAYYISFQTVHMSSTVSYASMQKQMHTQRVHDKDP